MTPACTFIPRLRGELVAWGLVVVSIRLLMLTFDFARDFARRWVAAWNAKDLAAVLDHYADDFTMESPFIATVAGESSGVLRGKAAVGAYWARALERYPDLRFILLGVHAGARSVVLRYRSVLDLTACEVFEFGTDGKVVRAAAHYDELDTARAVGRRPWFYATHVTPILNVSSVVESFAWFERLGWRKNWGWGDDQKKPTFGAVGAGQSEIFLCQNGQGGRGRGPNRTTFGGAGEDDTMDKGAWMSVWVDDVDAVHARCVEYGLDVTHPPTDEPWGVREMHVRHPDGHVLRVSRGGGC
jgi:ketosteroid isomerase-like protein/catechol 2,3-dioxygenase-like lactoylglutathione lyase family enzyme